MYVAVKGGEPAILNSYALLAEQRRGDSALPELTVAQIQAQLKLAVDRVMNEGSVFDPELAALAIKQASGDLVEAIFLLRAYRATLPRLAWTSRTRIPASAALSTLFTIAPPWLASATTWLAPHASAAPATVRAQRSGLASLTVASAST